MVFGWLVGWLEHLRPLLSPANEGEAGKQLAIGKSVFRCFKQCRAMADCLFNPTLPRNVGNARDIS